MALPKKRGLLSELLVILIWEGSDGCSNSFFISAASAMFCGEGAVGTLCGGELPTTFFQGEKGQNSLFLKC